MWCELDAVLCGCSQGRPVNEKTSRQELKGKKQTKQKAKHPLLDEAVPLQVKESRSPLAEHSRVSGREKKKKKSKILTTYIPVYTKRPVYPLNMCYSRIKQAKNEKSGS